MESIWSKSIGPLKNHESRQLKKNIKTDVLIVGGGLCGILCAHKLKSVGVDCVIAEAKTIGRGMTQNTTAKLTAQHGLIYSDLIKKFGIDKARLYFEANTKALEEFKSLSSAIDCDFEEKTAYVYSLNSRAGLEKEVRAYDDLSIPWHFREDTPLPLETVGAVGIDGQAQFNPMKFIQKISEGLDIYDNTFIESVVENKAYCGDNVITADNIILATHFPLVNIPGLYFLKMYQHRSYVIALENAPDVEGMYLDEMPNGFSFRNYKELLLIGGGDHKTGSKGGGYTKLRDLSGRAYPQAQEVAYWAAQDCMTLDAVPYIGIHRASAPNLYVATGFNKWGMTSSLVAANVLCDLITKRESPYQELFSPGRSMMRPQLAVNIFSSIGNLLRLGKRCPHMGCALKWNSEEKTWDCPCHGSRFDEKGNLIDNPAKRGI